MRYPELYQNVLALSCCKSCAMITKASHWDAWISAMTRRSGICISYLHIAGSSQMALSQNLKAVHARLLILDIRSLSHPVPIVTQLSLLTSPDLYLFFFFWQIPNSRVVYFPSIYKLKLSIKQDNSSENSTRTRLI